MLVLPARLLGYGSGHPQLDIAVPRQGYDASHIWVSIDVMVCTVPLHVPAFML